MEDNVSLDSSRAGTIILLANGKQYVCSAFQFRMALNQIQAGSVVVGCGRQILGDVTFDNNAEDLYEQIQQQTLSGQYTMLDCAVEEAIFGGSVRIFTGVIVSASLVYKTGAATIRAIRFELMGLSARLHSQPLTAYSNTCGAYIVQSILQKDVKQLTTLEALARQGMMSPKETLEKTVCSQIKNKIEQKDIATRVARIADALVLMSSHTINQLNPADIPNLGSVLGIDKCLYSSYNLNKEVLDKANTLTDEYFNESLCAGLLSGISGGSVFDAIARTLTSTEFMLSLVPHMDGRLEIKPTNAWGAGSNVKQLPLAAVGSINSSWHPLDHLNDPDVFAVNFSDALSMSGNQGTNGAPSTMIGVYSKDPSMATWLRERLTHNVEAAVMEEITKTTAHYKWRVTRSPNWLHDAIIRTDRAADDEKLQAEAIEAQKSKDTVNEPDADKAIIYDYTIGNDLADQVAQALYSILYKQHETAELELMPDARFGLYADKYGVVLEEMLGELIDIVPSEQKNEDRLSNAPLAIRGMITAVTFTYNAGASATCTYGLSLSHVRPIDPDEHKIDCPIYTDKVLK